MSIFSVTVSLLAFSIIFAHGSYIPTQPDPPLDMITLLPIDPYPILTFGPISSLAASIAPPSPFTPPSTKLRSALPVEHNGVLLNGTVINPNPDNYANATKSPHSCWTKPVKPAFPMEKGDFSPGYCQVCVMRWDTGADPMYQFWIRDAHNHAMGEMNATSLSLVMLPTLTVPAGNKALSLSEFDDTTPGIPASSWVFMTWQAGSELQASQMAFTTNLVDFSPLNNCSFSGSTESGTVINFQCHFECQL